MGVPKFFRWISERYPCLSELVKEYQVFTSTAIGLRLSLLRVEIFNVLLFQIPEFDNLYLDMNGIIHMCSHPNDFDPHFRITDEKIFKDIFHYIEVSILFVELSCIKLTIL